MDRKFNAVETIEDRLDGYEDIILSDFRRFNLAHLMDSAGFTDHPEIPLP